MSYRYLEELTWADVAFEVKAPDLEELFRSAADATLNVMVTDLSSIREREKRELVLRSGSTESEAATEAYIDQLLHEFLQKLVFFKDAERLLLRPRALEVVRRDGAVELRAELRGEVIDPSRHELLADVKAVTMHKFQVERAGAEWRACVVLDV